MFTKPILTNYAIAQFKPSPGIAGLSHSSGCSACDCEFVNLAKDLDVLLVTQDKKVLHNFPETAISMSQFLEAH